jgi:hypothetical protein
MEYSNIPGWYTPRPTGAFIETLQSRAEPLYDFSQSHDETPSNECNRKTPGLEMVHDSPGLELVHDNPGLELVPD